MNQIGQLSLAIKSLSVFRGILDLPVPGAFCHLLEAAGRTEEDFAEAWGVFFSALCEDGGTGDLCGCLMGTALCDENPFTLAAAGGTAIPPRIAAAAERDLNAILRASSLTPQDLLAGCGFGGARELDLPRWETGSLQEALRGAPLAERAAEFCRRNGCGVYSRCRAVIWREG